MKLPISPVIMPLNVVSPRMITPALPKIDSAEKKVGSP